MSATTIIQCVFICLGSLWLLDDERPEQGRDELKRFQSYVGNWSGVGQVRRGSTQGAWTEQSEWAWRFDDQGAALTLGCPKGKHIRRGALRSLEGQRFQFTVSTPGEGVARYQGAIRPGDKLVLELQEPASPTAKGLPSRISIRQVAAGKRMLVLFERRTASGRYARMGEVGYTRKGSNFGQGTAFVECVVTGGKGTIPVTHKGKTYYVCCGGCRDYFNENPEAVLAEYRDKKRKLGPNS